MVQHKGEFSVRSCFLGIHAVSIALQPACQEVTWLLSREGAYSLARKKYWRKIRQIPCLFKRFFLYFWIIWQQEHRCIFCLRLDIFLDAFSVHVPVIHSLR